MRAATSSAFWRMRLQIMLIHLGTWFANPALLWLLTALPGLAFLLWNARRRRTRALALLGQYAALRKLHIEQPAVRRWRTVCLFLGLAILIVGAAGPRWGRAPASYVKGPTRD